ncbi:MAG: hypothetical protein AAF633_26225, partial [Chloroflexota bacterium]
MKDLVFPELDSILDKKSPYVDRYRAILNKIKDQLWLDLSIVPKLSQNDQQFILKYFLELACQAQNAINIDMGRASIMELPADWLIEN